MRTSTRVLAASLSLGLAALASACAGDARPLENPIAAAEHATAPSSAEEKEKKPTVFDELALTKDQRAAIEAIRARIPDQLAGIEDARHVLVDALADSIALGHVDHARVDPAARLFLYATDRAKPALLDDVNEVHRVLDEKQRVELVDRLNGKHDDDDDAHEKKTAKEKKGKSRGERMMDALHLSFSQTIAITAALASLTEHSDQINELKEQLDAAGDAFKETSFDAHQLAIAHAPLVEVVVDQSLAALDAVLPELDDYQHHVLAEIARRVLDAKDEGRAASSDAHPD